MNTYGKTKHLLTTSANALAFTESLETYLKQVGQRVQEVQSHVAIVNQEFDFIGGRLANAAEGLRDCERCLAGLMQMTRKAS